MASSVSYAIQETWRDRRGKKHYGPFHEGSRRIAQINKDALFATIAEAREDIEGLSEYGEVDNEIELEIVNVITRMRYPGSRKGGK